MLTMTELKQCTNDELQELIAKQHSLSRLLLLGCSEYELRFRKVSARIVRLRQWIAENSTFR